MKKKFYKWSLIAVMIYTQIFANSCNNSTADKSAKVTGTIKWVKKIITDPENSGSVGYLLTAGQKIFVVTQKKILAYDNVGHNLWDREHWPLSPVSLRFNRIYFTSAEGKSQMQAVDFDNKIVVEDFWMPEIVERSFLVLFEPIEKGLMAQVQYQPDPDSGPMGFVIYRIHDGALGTEWEKSFDKQKSKLIPIINIDKNILVTNNASDAFVFDIQSKGKNVKPLFEFPLPLADHTMWLSSSKNGDLYWLGEDNKETILNVTGLNGELLWEWKSEEVDFSNFAIPILPAIVAPDIQFIITPKKLFAFQLGKKIWEIESDNLNFSNATALNDNTILVIKGSVLIHYNSEGKEIFNLEMGENIITAPVVDENGRIFIASNENLYCIE
jgi:outer membrane protein assembly factor BamB